MTALADSFHFRDDPDAAPRPSPPRLQADAPMIALLAAMSEESGVPPMRLARDFAGLSFGPGRVSFSDYVRFRLHDDTFWAGDRRHVVGQRRGRERGSPIKFSNEDPRPAAKKVQFTAPLAAIGFSGGRARAVPAP